jgi:eukaryotic-like serine/threonine-protein kinase
MPSPTTIDAFLDLVRKSGVVNESRLLTHVDRLRAAGTLPGELAPLASILVRDGLLTPFWAEQLLQGKWRRFSIGNYKVLDRLGAGSMASVYLCEHKGIGREVAVKVLPTRRAEDPSSLERFYREARAGAAMKHPNVVEVYDIDQEENLHFLVTEYVDGNTLEEVVLQNGAPEWGRAAHYVRQAALGLQHAHERGLVHRDVKPGNLLLDRSGIVKVFDWGLAAFHDPDDRVIARTYSSQEIVHGNPDYIAPEQALNFSAVDHRADIYSLGMTFYFCLTGHPPFEEGTLAQKLIWHQARYPTPLRTLRPEVPEGLAAIVDRMTAKDPGQRYPTAAGVAAALEPWTRQIPG